LLGAPAQSVHFIKWPALQTLATEAGLARLPPQLSQVTLPLCAANVWGVVFFDHFPYKKIPVSDQNLHKNIFWRKMHQRLVGDTMKRKKWLACRH
jgi:hypothetical protein